MKPHLFFHIFFIPFYLILLSVSGQCQSDQQSILIQLKNSFQFNSSLATKLVSWNPNVTDCCSWLGVTCSTTGQVIGLDLSNETISVGINDSSVLFDLQNLESLNLAGNNFHFVQIPSRFGSFASLKNLNLSNSGFSGQIPGELSQLSTLEVLDLSSLFSFGARSLRLENPNLATLVQNFTKLRGLYLDNVNISSQRFDWGQSLSSSLRNLEVLSLSNCQLSGPLDDSLQKLQSLSEIHLALNNISAPVPDFFANFTNLTVMNLGSCNLLGSFPNKVLQLQNLQILDLAVNNNLSGYLPDFPINGSLRSLLLRNTNFSGGIPETIGNLKNLSRIELFSSNFSGRIPKSIQDLTQLGYIDLSSNNFIGQVPSFQMCKNLTHVDLSRNGLSVACGQTQHNNWSKLQIVDISSNYLNGEIPKNCFRQWAAMMNDDNRDPPKKKHLSFTVLQLSNYYYQDTVTVTAKGLELELVKILTVFTSIDISNNNFSGEIPRAIGQLKALYVLNVSRNAFTGSIPPSMGNLSQLESLDMSSNKLTGEIPYTLASLTFLSTLNLSNNRLKGRIPISNQFQTFENDSYLGNKELCGLPLTRNCPGSNIPTTENPTPFQESKNGYDWQFIFTGVGFGSGAAIVTAPITLTKTGRYLWNDYTNKLVITICLVLGIRYAPCRVFEEDEDDEKEAVSSDENSDDSEFESVADRSKGRYCVYCTKLDFSRKQAIHDAKCTCFDQTKLLSTSSSTSSSEAASPFTKL
ncbi:putative leucine-rich repeat-containing, plant-type, leucine-rich repeat domain superfamily [Helianthus debilis subsp. tardiflorus]